MSEDLNDALAPVFGADPDKIQMSDFEVSTREELVQMGAYVPVVVPRYDKYTADGHVRPDGDFDNKGKNYIFKLDIGGSGGGGMTPEQVREIVDDAVGQEATRATEAESALSEDIGSEVDRATGAEGALSDRIDAIEGQPPSVLVGWDNEAGYSYDSEEDSEIHIFDVYLLNVSGTDVRVDANTHRVKCKAGWYHVDATFSIGGKSDLPEYLHVWTGVGVNGAFGEYSNYDRVDHGLFHDGDNVLHVSTTVCVVADDSTLDFAIRMSYGGEGEFDVTAYLDQFSVCKVASFLAGGGGAPSGDSDVAVFHIDFDSMLLQYTEQADYIEASRQMWTDMVEAAFNDKVVLASIRGLGSCIVEFPQYVQGAPVNIRESLLEYMKQYPEEGTISFCAHYEDANSSSFYRGSSCLYRFDLDWVNGFQPQYFAFVSGAYGVSMAVSDLYDPVDDLTRCVDCYNITPYKLEFGNPDFTGVAVLTDYSKMLMACTDMAKRGYSFTADVSMGITYMGGTCYAHSYYGGDEGELTVTGLYTDENGARLLGNYACTCYYYEADGPSYWLVDYDDLVLCARGGRVRTVVDTDFALDSESSVYYVNVYNGDSVYVESLPDTDFVQFRVCEAPSMQWSTYNENVSIRLPVNIQGESLSVDVTDSDGYSLLRQAGALTTLVNNKDYAIEIHSNYFNCVELDSTSSR